MDKTSPTSAPAGSFGGSDGGNGDRSRRHGGANESFRDDQVQDDGQLGSQKAAENAAWSHWSTDNGAGGMQGATRSSARSVGTILESGHPYSAALMPMLFRGKVPEARGRLHTDGLRHEHDEAIRSARRPRSTSWDHALKKKKRRESIKFDFDILTRTNFRLDEDHKVHIPDDDDEDENQVDGSQGAVNEDDKDIVTLEEGVDEDEDNNLEKSNAMNEDRYEYAVDVESAYTRHGSDGVRSVESPRAVTRASSLGSTSSEIIAELQPGSMSPRFGRALSDEGDVVTGSPRNNTGRLSRISSSDEDTYSTFVSVTPSRSPKAAVAAETHPLLGKQDSNQSMGSYLFNGGSPRTGGQGNWRFSFRKFWLYCGPGWLMSVAYLDPGNIESDLQAGAFHGYQLLWVLSVATILGLFFQCLAVRLGVVMNKNLAEACREHYSRGDTYVLFTMMQLAVIGSDCQELLGSAIAFRVLFGIPLWVGCLLTGLDTLTFLGLHVIGVRQLELFFVILIGLMVLCFVGTFFSDPGDPVEMARGLFVPYVQEEASVQAVSILGAVVMPHNIFLHSALVLSRDIDRSRPHRISEANFYFSIEAAVALFVSLLINAAVVSVFAHGFFSETCSNMKDILYLEPGNIRVEPPYACVPNGVDSHSKYSTVACMTDGGVQGTCMPIGLQGAASALGSFVGNGAAVIWSIGLLAAGQSSTMTGTYAGQFIMEGFLELEIPNWVRVGLTRAVSLIPALIVAVLANSNMLAADKLDELLNVWQSLQLPFALFPLLLFTGSSRYMGQFRNSFKVQILGVLICLLVLMINFYLVFNTVDFIAMSLAGKLSTLGFASVYMYILSRLAKNMWYSTDLGAAYRGAAPTTHEHKHIEESNGHANGKPASSSGPMPVPALLGHGGYGALDKNMPLQGRSHSQSIPSLD